MEYSALYVRLRRSTIEQAKDAQRRSNHRTLTSWVDAALRRETARQREIAKALTDNAGDSHPRFTDDDD